MISNGGSAHGNDLDHSFYFPLKKPAYRTTLLVWLDTHSQVSLGLLNRWNCPLGFRNHCLNL
nr:hypothetical protein Q903MT_gene3955 [Picea sitchensis]